MKLLPIAFILMLLAPPAVAAEPIGRLFYTPEQRASLDVVRSKRVRTGVAAEKADEAPPPPPAPEVITYGGIVRRSDGKTTVWINNRAVTEKDAANAGIAGKLAPDGTVRLHSAQTGRSVDIRVGQRAELLSGRVEEGYRRAPAPKPEDKGDSAGTKPAPETAAAAETERRREERERQENLDDAIRAMRDAAQARSAGTAPQEPVPAPLQQPGASPMQVLAPGPAQATK